MQSAGHTGDSASGRAKEDAESNDAESWVALLEKMLSTEQTASPEEETKVRTRLLLLYLDELDDPLSAAVHAEVLLDRKTADKAVVDAARALVEYRPIAARMAGKLSAAYARLGEIPSEIGMLSKEMSLARPPRLDQVKLRLAELRFVHLHDVDGALALLEPQVLRSPGDDALRTRYLEMTAGSGRRARAVGTLLRINRTEKNGAVRARILTELSSLHLQDGDRRGARDAFFQALEAAGRGPEPQSLPVWLSQFRELTRESDDASRDADVLVAALDGRVVDCPELVELACAAVDSLLAAGRDAHARALCAALLSSAPAALALHERYDRLAGGEEPATARFARYETALMLASAPEERRRILKVLAAICREDLDDLPRAMELSQRLLREDPKDLDELLGLLSAYERLGLAEALFAEIEHALFLFEGEQCLTVLLRKASALANFGQGEQSAELRATLLEQPDLPPSVVESILAATYEDDQFDVYRKALELLVASGDAAVRMRALERLGDFHFEQRGDGPAAIESWKPAARLYVEESSEDSHGRELYERVLEVVPNDDESALELVALYAKSGDWAHMPEVYGALLRSGAGIDAAIATLLDVEGAAARAGAVDEYVSMVDETIPHLSVRDDDSHRRLLRVKARMLSAEPRREPEASAAHRQVLESFGSGDDIGAYAAFIESRGSFDDRRTDLRWLFEFRANRAPDPLSVLNEWARFEEGHGDLDGAVLVQRRMAAFLVDELGRPGQGAPAIERWLREARPWAERLDIVRRALAPSETRAAVVDVVLRATSDAGPEEAAALLGLVVGAAGGDRDIPESSRSAWYTRLIELHSNDPDSALELAARGVRDLPDARPLWEALARLSRPGSRTGRAAEAYRGALSAGMAPETADAVGGIIIGLLDESAADPDEILGILGLIIERAPRARWALDRATLLLSARGRWEELFVLYGHAIESAAGDGERLELLNEAAVAARDLAREPERAISFHEAILELRPSDAFVQGALERLYERAGKTEKLAHLLSSRVELATGLARLELLHRLAAARLDLGHVAAAAEAVEKTLEYGAPVTEVIDILVRLLDTCTGEARAAPKAPAVAEWAASLLSAHYTACGRIAERRQLRVQIASMLAEVSNEPERAVRAFDELFAEDAGDVVAESCVARFASLLASAGRTREQADLWERIGHCRGLSGDGARAAEAWSRAASLREDLEDSGRAVAAHSAAAALGSDAAIAALGRLHVAAGRWLDAAQSLEWLFQGLTGERRLECGLTVADAYARAGEVQLARCRLVELVAAEPDAWSPRARLLELYRDGEAWKPLAELLADAARLAPGRESRLELLKEAIHIRLRRLRDPEGAAALAAVALGVDPQSMATRLELGEALVASGRHDESVTVLREGLTGAGGSKQDAQLHRAIAVALLGAGRRKEALVELEAAARLHPAEPGTLHALGRVAFDEGNLDLAEATLRGLVLVLHHGAPAGCEGPSRAQVYLDLSRIAELRGDPVRARDLAESAFDSALESPDEAARLERTLEERGSHGLLALVLERRLRSGADLETTAQALDALVTLWEGPLGRAADMATVIARHAGLVAREAEATRNVGRSVWAAHVRACAAVGGEAARVEAVKRYIVQLARAAEALDGDEATSVLLEMARQYQNGLGQFEGAAAIAEGLFEKDPTRVDVWLLLRDLYGHLGKPERLVDLAETMLWSTQSSAAQKQLRLDLARALLESPAKADLAIATLEGILEDEPNDSEARDALAGVLEREGRHEELAAVLAAGLGLLDGAGRRGASMWLGRVVENPQFRDRLLTTFEEDGRQDEALEVLGRALLRDPSDVDLLRRRAWIYQAIGRLDDAISDLEQAYTADRGLADDLVAVLAEAAPGEGGRRSLELIDLLLALDRASDARSAVEALLERMPRHVGGMERLASFAAADGDSVLVLQIYRELLPLLKEDPAALVRVSLAFAAVCDDQGERADVTEALEHAYRLVPANDELRNRLASVRARALAKLGRLDEAEAVLLELCKMPRGQGAVLVSSVHLELARLYLSRDDLVEAFDCLKRAFSANEKNDEASLLLGLVAIDLDDDRTALRALRAASSSRSVLAPESKAIAQQQLARIARGAGDAKRASVAPGTRDAKRLS